MKQTQKNLHQRFGLTALFSAIVFLILIITSVLIFIIGVLLIRTNALNLAKLSRQEPMVPIFVLLVVSVVVGTVVSFMISRFPLKPIRRVIDATNRFIHPASLALEADVPQASVDTRLSTLIRVILRVLGSGIV